MMIRAADDIADGLDSLCDRHASYLENDRPYFVARGTAYILAQLAQALDAKFTKTLP